MTRSNRELSWPVRGAHGVAVLALLMACSGESKKRADAEVDTDAQIEEDDADVGDTDAGVGGNDATTEDADSPKDDGGSPTDDARVPADGGTASDASLDGSLGFPTAPKRHIAVSNDGVCVIAQDRSVVCSDSRTPKGAENHDFERISGSGFQMCGVRTDGSMYCWFESNDAKGYLPAGSGFVDVIGPSNVACGLTRDGAVHCAKPNQTMMFLEGVYQGPFLQLISLTDTEFCGLTSGRRVRCMSVDGKTREPPLQDVSCAAWVNQGFCGIAADKSLRCIRPGSGPDEWVPFGNTITARLRALTAGSSSLCYIDEASQASCRTVMGSEMLEPPTGVSFVDLGQGQRKACGIATNGEVWCWEDLSLSGKAAYKVTLPKAALTD